MKKDYLVLVGLAVALLAAIGLCSACTDRVIPAPAPTEVPTVAAPEPAATDASPPPTDTPSPTAEPTTEPTAPVVTTIPERVMYFCGYDRCEDSAEYGQLLFETGITVWEGPDPDRGDRLRHVNSRDAAVVVSEMRVGEGPGGLWYELQDGGWINDLWLTDEKCSIYNLPELSFESCLGTEAATEPTAAPTPLAATVTLAPTATRIPTFTLAPTTEVATPTRLPTATPSLTFTPPLPPTKTASPTPVPTQTDTQAPTVTPSPIESGTIEVTAWVSDASPSQDSDVTVYGKITRGGRGVSGVSMHTTWRYQTTWSYCDGTSGADGQASCTRDIGRATEGYRVTVTVRFTYEGRDYRAHTEFTPR